MFGGGVEYFWENIFVYFLKHRSIFYGIPLSYDFGEKEIYIEVK